MNITSLHEDYLRSTIFGFEDGLVSTTGVVVGVAVGAQSTEVVLLAGFVAIAAEALSMGAGQFLSERAVHQLNHNDHRDNVVVGALLMFFAYAVAGLVPLLPFVFIELTSAIPISIVAAFLALALLGYAKGRVVRVSPARSALEMLAIGGAATLVGIAVGLLLKV